MEENLLIMFREFQGQLCLPQRLFICSQLGKLREGLQSSKRCDSFAYEVYETSAYLAVIASNGRHQALPILSHLIFELERLKPSEKHLEDVSPSPEMPTLFDAVLIYLLEILSLNHPSQSGFLVALQEARVHQRISPSVEFFLHHLATALRRIDTVLLRHLLHPDSSAVKLLFDAPGRPPNPNSLMADAFGVLLGRIRSQARLSAWLCVRTAYRELSVNASGEWLVRSLLLGDSTCNTGADAADADEWLQDRARSGEAQEMLRDGGTVPGRWSLRRPPS